MHLKRITVAIILSILAFILTACDFQYTLPFFNKIEDAVETVQDGEEIAEDVPVDVELPPIYVTVALHLEAVPGYANCQAFTEYREKLLEFAKNIAPFEVAVNLQSDYEFLLGVTRCETPQMQATTNGQNVINYLVENYGYEIDAHQQGGWDHGGKDNYADIRWLAGDLTAGVSETMGGLVFDDPVQWRNLAEGQTGLQTPTFTWKPQALTLAVDSRHRLGDFMADDFASGVWIPAGTGSDFWAHDQQGPFVYIGPGEYDNWNNKHGKRSTPDFVRDLLLLLEKGELDPTLIYTATLAVPQSIIFNATEHAKLLALLDQLAPLSAEGKVIYANYSEIIEIWQQQFDARPNIYFKDGIADNNQDEGLVEQREDSPPLKAGENTFKVVNPTSNVTLYVTVYIPEIWDRKNGLPTLVLVPGGTGNSRGFIKENPGGVSMVSAINDAGMIAVVFDPDGRGLSSGVEDHGGHIQQDGLAAVVSYVAALSAVDEDMIGLATFSYGITMGSGALARHRDLPVQFLIDWEGPADRDDTGGCDEHNLGHLGSIAACDDESFWSEREAAAFISRVKVPYQRIQGAKDHVQPDQAHTVLMINNAVKGSCPWVRLNDEVPNQSYSLETIPLRPSGDSRKPVEALLVHYAIELFGL